MISQLDLPLATVDYSEGWEPGQPTCFDCAYIRRPPGGFMDPDWCNLHGFTVDRVVGKCSDFKEAVG